MSHGKGAEDLQAEASIERDNAKNMQLHINELAHERDVLRKQVEDLKFSRRIHIELRDQWAIAIFNKACSGGVSLSGDYHKGVIKLAYAVADEAIKLR